MVIDWVFHNQWISKLSNIQSSHIPSGFFFKHYLSIHNNTFHAPFRLSLLDQSYSWPVDVMRPMVKKHPRKERSQICSAMGSTSQRVSGLGKRWIRFSTRQVDVCPNTFNEIPQNYELKTQPSDYGTLLQYITRPIPAGLSWKCPPPREGGGGDDPITWRNGSGTPSWKQTYLKKYIYKNFFFSTHTHTRVGGGRI